MDSLPNSQNTSTISCHIIKKLQNHMPHGPNPSHLYIYIYTYIYIDIDIGLW
ncbi:hypothetical protein HanRHA438_Chr02g0062261 [Helianthus annuus]|nr:hypothetical protein HanRHA438_Chr02g0062261 [Helianthus annuus]